MEYDIEQINNKQNEEKAVVGQLKENIAAARAERVVSVSYSKASKGK